MMIKCPECGKEISDKAVSCPNCGSPISSSSAIDEKKEEREEDSTSCQAIQNFDSGKPKKEKQVSYVIQVIWDVIKWVIALFVMILSLVSFSTNIFGFFILLICAVMICPLSKRITKKFSTMVRVMTPIILFIIGVIVSGSSYTTDNADIPVDEQVETETEVVLETESDTTTEEETEEVDNTEKVQESTESTEKQEQEEDELLVDLKTILSDEVAEEAYDILMNQIGFSSVSYIEPMNENTSNYYLSLDGTQGVMTASDEVYRIFIPSSSYTFYENGKVVMTAEEFSNKHITSGERISYYIIAQGIIENYLINPSSADFPSINTSSDIAMQKNGDIVVVQGYVDAKNSLGAKVRTEYTVEFKVIDIDMFSYDLIYINLGGETSGEFISLD